MQSRRARKSPSRIQQISQAISGRDLASLKHLARTGDGLVTTRLRRRAWPLLLNFRSLLDPGTHHDKHPDEPQVALDVPRTHVFQSNELRRSDDGVRRRQEQLHGVVNGVLRAYPWLRYYQGFHELAMPFVCVFGSAGAAREALRMVALFFVRDALASGLDPVVQQLQLLAALLARAAPGVHALLEELGVPPFYAISWVLTWFAHDVGELGDVCRIYDFLLASGPLQVVYVAAAVVRQGAAQVLGLGRDFAAVHAGLAALPRGVRAWARVLEDSAALASEFPPAMLQQMGGVLARRSAVNTFEATWTRLDPARPLQFTALVPGDRHPLSAPKASAATAKAAALKDVTQWPVVVATMATVTIGIYAWLLANKV